MTLEESGKMTLAAEACCRSDLNQRSIASRKLTTGEFDTQLANILSDCTPVVFTECARQMNRMHADRFGDTG
jgi:hypothetical protein